MCLKIYCIQILETILKLWNCILETSNSRHLIYYIVDTAQLNHELSSYPHFSKARIQFSCNQKFLACVSSICGC